MSKKRPDPDSLFALSLGNGNHLVDEQGNYITITMTDERRLIVDHERYLQDLNHKFDREIKNLKRQLATPSTKSTKPGERLDRATKALLRLLDRGMLPPVLRQAQRLLLADGHKSSTVRDAVLRSDRLLRHFPKVRDLNNVSAERELLDELSSSNAHKYLKLPVEHRQDLEDFWKEGGEGSKAQAMNLVKILITDPEAGSTGDVRLIEGSDQDSRSD